MSETNFVRLSKTLTLGAMAAWKAAHAVNSPEVRRIDEYLRKDVE